MKLNLGVIPPEGYHFPVAQGVILRASTHELLVKQIEDWRIQNGIPIGNPIKDIDDYVCRKWPTYCQPGDNEQAAMSRNSQILRMVSAWSAIMMRNTPAGGYDLVDQTEATRRASICLGCPFAKSWRSGCSNCMSSTDAVLSRLRKLRKIALDDNLMGCIINSFDCKTAIHLPESAFNLTEEQKQSLPQNCWLNKNQN